MFPEVGQARYRVYIPLIMIFLINRYIISTSIFYKYNRKYYFQGVKQTLLSKATVIHYVVDLWVVFTWRAFSLMIAPP